MRFAAIGMYASMFLLLPAVGPGHDAKQPADANVETVLSGLEDPAGIALQPETGVVFVAESGAGRIGRIVDGKLEVVVQGSPTEAQSSGTSAVGPLGLVFVDKQTLAVGDGGYAAGEDFIRIYKLGDDAETPLEYDAGAEVKLGPVPAKDSDPALGNFAALALARHGLYVAAGADGSNGWVLKASLKGTKFGELERTIKTSTESLAAIPECLTLSSRGEIVVGLLSVGESSAKSSLAFYSAKTNDLLLNLETGLESMSAIGYSPKTGLLYALGVSAAEGAESGLYRLDSDTASGEQKIKATKIATLDRPAAFAFDKEGTAYITVRGASQGADDKPAGAVMKVSGL